VTVLGGPNLGPALLRWDNQISKQGITPGTVRRVIPYALRYRWSLVVLLLMTALDAVIATSSPLILKLVIDEGILPRRLQVVAALSLLIAGLAVIDAVAVFVQARFSGRVGEGIIYDLRTALFSHVQRQPMAFFTRAQTGSLVNRLNSDVLGAQQAITTLLTQTVSAVLTLVLVLAAMLYLSWQITIVGLLLVPCFVLPGKLIGRRLQWLSREAMVLDAQMASMANERFNVAGAMLAKLYGHPDQESETFAGRAARVRDIAVLTVLYGRMFVIVASLVTALTTALVYGVGGRLAINGQLELGTLVAMVTLMLRLYGPVNQLSSMQINIMTALVSFDRVFEVLDLEPLIREQPGAIALPRTGAGAASAPELEFADVWFRYPSPAEVSLASLEPIALHPLEQSEGIENPWVIKDLSFTVPAGKLTALVGPSGAGKTTISQLVPRLYDPVTGTVRIGGHDLRNLTLRSLNDTIGVVTQDAHMFHDTIRANLLYARPDASEADLIEACRAARIWETISALPDKFDTTVGDRGYRLSGGEKQRIALARLMLKSPPIVVLDEATAHLDSESEAAIQRALKTALAGRTSLVIAHRLSTIRDADQILVIVEGRVQESGTHDELLAAGGLYRDLYHTQFAPGAAITAPTTRGHASA
jgi:ATP-binding cassette subfamily B protein